MESITAIIITKNEEKNIENCIKSIQDFVSRIIVVDSGSTDNTQQIAKELGAEVYFRKFDTHARQRNWALDTKNISSKWVLRIDADERLTPILIDELKQLINLHNEDDVTGISVSAWLFFMGKKLKFGGPRKRKIILFKTGKGRIEDRRMDEHTYLLEGRSVSAKNKYLHYDFKDLDNYVKKLNWYAEREMQDYFEVVNSSPNGLSDGAINKTRKKKFGFYYKLPLFLRCKLFFFYQFFLKGNFLNGKEGRLYSYLYHYYYRMLVDGKIYEHIKTKKDFNDLESL